MTLFEGVALVNLFISLALAYKLGKASTDIEVLYEGLALTMDQVGMTKDD
jgi:hypothetical protein